MTKTVKNMSFSKGACLKKKKSACGKPETPQAWVGVTNPYKKGIYIIKY